MQDNPLQQLRDVHAPMAPEWWPPAPGWWLLGIAVIASTVFICRLLWRAYRARQPIRSARTLIDQLKENHQQGRIDTLHYVHETNEVLKRLLVNALGIRHLAATSDEQWLGALDTIVGDCAFSEGHGKIFGAQRFRLKRPPMSKRYIKLCKNCWPACTQRAPSNYFQSA